MAARALLHLGDPSNKCIFTTVQCHKARLHPQTTFRQVRNFRKARDTGKQAETPFPNVYVETGPVQPSKLWKPFGFTVMFSGATIVGAAIWEYERIREHTYRVINQYQPYRVRRSGWRADVESWWRGLSEGQKIFVPICFANVLVFLAWRVPALQGTMVRYFCANPASSAMCWPMLLSTFSHYSLLHLAANMYVLHSFSTAAVAALGREQFVAVYLTSGVMSSFASHFYKTAFTLPGLSLGASGAIMGVLGFVCTQYPETRLSILFLPMYTFTAGMAIKAIMGLDALGCFLGWRYFDHAAHLGGALWGIFWQSWGNANIWQKREPVLTFWHDLRDPPRSH